MVNLRTISILAAASLALAACATWSTSETTPRAAESGNSTAGTTSDGAAAPKMAATDPAKVVVTEGDITDRSYKVLGDIKVTVNKTTLFHPDPTKEMVAKKLQAEAAKLGADAVILVRYGTVGVSFMSWGSLDGRGRAVAYVN